MKKVFIVLLTLAVSGFVFSALVASMPLPIVYKADGDCQYVGQVDSDGREVINDCGMINLSEDRYNVVQVAPLEYVSRLQEESLHDRFEEAVQRGEHIPSVE